MTSLSDTLTVGLVLVLLFGSVALYLYTRIQQAEQKISLLESILLEVKMSAEIKSYSELPASAHLSPTEQSGSYIPFEHELEEVGEDTSGDFETYQPKSTNEESGGGRTTPSVSGSVNDSVDNEVDQYKSIIAEAVKNEETEKLPMASKISANYESMTIKELQTLAKTRGITGATSMKKGSIIEALKTSDRSTTSIEPGSGAVTGSFLATSSPFQPSSTVSLSDNETQ